MKSLVLFTALALVGCSKSDAPAGSASVASGAPFLDQTKPGVLPNQDWTREIVSRNGGTIKYRVEVPGPYSLTIITDKGFKAIQARNMAQFAKSDVLLTTDLTAPYEATINLAAGSYWFIITNGSASPVDIRLTCWESN